ncbi:MAG: hypothetical protein AAGC88_01995 [Bacteroidota bacterium]
MDFYQNQEVIFNSDYSAIELEFNQGRKLNDLVFDIDSQGIHDIYYEGEKENEPIATKIKMLKENNGWIHFKNGTSFNIKKGRINEVMLRKSSIDRLGSLNSNSVMQRLGQPSRVEHDFITYVFDQVDEGDIYHYQKSGLSIQFDPESDKIKEIRIK